MKINRTRLEAAFLIAQKTLETQSFPDFMKERWGRALEKARDRLIEQPYFAWQPEQLTIVSIPNAKSRKKNDQPGCRFYRANSEKCCRVDKLGFCQAFYEGFPCWHRAAFWLLGFYFDKPGNNCYGQDSRTPVSTPNVNQS